MKKRAPEARARRAAARQAAHAQVKAPRLAAEQLRRLAQQLRPANGAGMAKRRLKSSNAALRAQLFVVSGPLLLSSTRYSEKRRRQKNLPLEADPCKAVGSILDSRRMCYVGGTDY